MNDAIKHNTACRICGNKDFVKILDLGAMPPANAFLREADLAKEEQKFPLVVYFCEKCFLLQLLDVVNPEILFGEYDYVTSASRPLAEHFEKSAIALVQRFNVNKSDLVIEIGGNDGVLLSAIKDQCRTLNIEPARIIAKLSEERGIPTINSFFTSKEAENVLKKHGGAALVLANNVMAHIDNIQDAFIGVKKLIGERGVFVFEVHWVGNLISEGGFDQIYHEHLCYHALHDLDYLAKSVGLRIFDVERIPIHGESLRVYVGKNNEALPAVADFLRHEEELGLTKAKTYLKFAEKVEKGKEAFKKILGDLKESGKTIVGYGAPAKGNTLLNYYEVTTGLVSFLTDTTPPKQGTYAPGTRIPVVDPEAAKENKPDYFLLLAWNYADAILKKEEEFRRNGGKFIIPVPEPRIV